MGKKGTDGYKELVRHLGVECEGVIFVTYSLLVQTGNRRQVFPVQVRNDKDRKQLMSDILDGQMKYTKAVKDFGEEGSQVSLQVGDKVVGVESLRMLQAKAVP